MRTLLQVVRRLLLALAALGARIEFTLWSDNHRRPQPCRRLYLRLQRVQHGPRIYCGPEVMIRAPGHLVIGDRCALGWSTRIWNYAPVTIGADFTAAAGLTINTGGHDIETMRGVVAPIRIGDRVWCGLNVSILAGVTIGDDVVIAAGAVVTQDIPSGSVAAGVPARVVRSLQRDLTRFDRGDWGPQP